MKKLFATAFILLSMMGFMILNSCINECNDGPFVFTTDSISVDLLQINGISNGYRDYYTTQNINNTDTATIRYDSLIIGFNSVQKLVQENQYFQGALYACSPAEKYDKITNIEITSDHDYNTLFPKGSNLVSLFNIHDGLETKGTGLINSVINGLYFSQNIYLKLNLAPLKKDFHRFTFKFTLDNNKVITLSLPVIYVK